MKTSKIQKVKSQFKTAVSRAISGQTGKEREIERLIASGLPAEMRSCLRFLASDQADADAEAVTESVEAIRAKIAAEGDKEVEIWYSPKPGSDGEELGSDRRPQPGKALRFTMERIAQTGKDRRWGTALYLLARDFKSSTVCELGSCAGISACYLASSPTINQLLTVEGSEDLAKIAANSLASFSGKAKVINRLFDDAIDKDLPLLQEKVDFAFIDGHHEKIATIHYYERLRPYLAEPALVVFDDISWSHDMREAWDILRVREEFSQAVDLGAIGICIYEGSGHIGKPVSNWDLQSVLGRFPIGEPKGWEE